MQPTPKLSYSVRLLIACMRSLPDRPFTPYFPAKLLISCGWHGTASVGKTETTLASATAFLKRYTWGAYHPICSLNQGDLGDMLPPRSVHSPLDSAFASGSIRSTLPLIPPTASAQSLVQLNFDDLAVYELVKTQYWGLGVRFEGAIVIQPSNPAFSPRSGHCAIMPVAGRNDITVYFRTLQHQVSAFLTGARQVRLTAYDQAEQVVGEVTGGSHHYVKADSQSADPFPRYLLELVGNAITKVSFSSESPFILDDFACASGHP